MAKHSWLVLGLVLSVPGLPAQHDARAWFGFALSCSWCTWTTGPEGGSFEFTEPPVVVAVESRSPAQRAGLQPGDTLVSIDGVGLATPAGWRRFSGARPGRPVRLGYRRGAREFATAAVPERWPTAVQPDTPDRTAPKGESAPQRFAGTFAGVNVEVRGVPDVRVTIAEGECWLEIATPDAWIRLRGGTGCQARR